MSAKRVHVQLPFDDASPRQGASSSPAPTTSGNNTSAPASGSRPRVDKAKPSKKSFASSLFKPLSSHRAAARSSSLQDRVTVPSSSEGSKKSAQSKTPTQSKPGHPMAGVQMTFVA